MRVGMYYNNKDVRVEEMPKPAICSGELLLKVRASGICGSDVMEWYRIKKAPLVLGHEVTGEIVDIGKDVKSYKIGDRVFVSHHVPCNTCRYCLAGHHTACDTLHTTNFYPGGFSEYIRVPQINVDRGTFILPDELSYEDGTFIEPLACVVRGQFAAQFQIGQDVLILGSGISGLLHLLLARAQGAGRIIVTDINEYRLNKAREFGADIVINVQEKTNESLRKICGLARLVIICTSNLSAFITASQCVDRGGTILCFAPTEAGAVFPLPVNELWRNNVKIIHSYGSSPKDSMTALELLHRKIVSVKNLITHRLTLDEIALGFNLAAEGKESIKIIIEPRRYTHEGHKL